MKSTEKTTAPALSGDHIKLAILVFIITLTGILLIIGIYFDLEQKEVKSTEEQLMLIARSAARNLENYLSGYSKDFKIIASTPQFEEGFELYKQTGDAMPMINFMSNYNNATGSKIGDIMITDNDGNILVSTSVNTPYTNCAEMLDIKSDMLIFSSQSGSLYLGISAPLDDSHRIMSMVEIEQMYSDTASSMEIGKNGYVMYKHSSGMIIMHPVKEQIGWDVLSDRKKKYPNYDFSDLEGLVARQKQGLSNVEIYNSYWWADENPHRVKKISAYVPAYFGDDFLIVSTVADFNEIMAPLNLGLLSMGIVLLVLGITFATMVLMLLRSISARQGIEKENLYLRDLNSSLEEIHKSEEKLRHFQRLQTIGTLTGGIAHELNNMLTPIMAYSALLMDTIPIEDEMHGDIEEIYSASTKAKEVIQQISLISRKDNDAVFVTLNVKDGLTRSLRMVNSVKPKNVTLDIHLDFADCCQMIGSDTQLTQIVLNLSTNAFHAMEPQGGTLTVAARILSEDGDGSQSCGESLIITFTDTGSGIDFRLLTHIFDPFFTTKKTGEGTGLGLSIVQSIAESHGGTIDVTSTVGVGTTFTLTLPVTTRPISHSTTDGTVQQILLVGGDGKVLHMLTGVLNSAGYHTVSFTRVGDAIDYLHEDTAIEMMIVDYAMQKSTGLELALLCRNLRGTIPILLMTSFVDRDVVDARRNGIINEYLVKPVSGQALLDAVVNQSSVKG